MSDPHQPERPTTGPAADADGAEPHAPGVPRDLDAQEAHGGSMAPGVVDDTGHPVEPSGPSADVAPQP